MSLDELLLLLLLLLLDGRGWRLQNDPLDAGNQIRVREQRKLGRSSEVAPVRGRRAGKTGRK